MKGGIAIIARLGSTRLKDKHLQKLNGLYAVDYLIGRINSQFRNEVAEGSLNVALFTGAKENNQELANCFSNYGLKSFFGSNENIPLRINDGMNYFDWDFVVIVDGDDLFCSTEGMKKLVRKLLGGADYVGTKGLPFGMNSTGFSKPYVESFVLKLNTSKLETGWGWVFDVQEKETIQFNCKFPDFLRFTLDYEEDLEFFRSIIAQGINWKEIEDEDLIRLVVGRKLYFHNKELSDEYWNNFYKQQKLEKGNIDG